MNHLSLFTGGGGTEWGALLLNWNCLGYVEWDDYCVKVIEQRIKDGFFSDAPIFHCDIKEWIRLGYARSYQGLVDVLTAGFPCQPFSVAGKQAGESDPRNLWPETLECIRIIRPRFAFLENVPGLLAQPYIRAIFGDLAESGYDCRWKVISAAEVGAPIMRDRLWIVAFAPSERFFPFFSKNNGKKGTGRDSAEWGSYRKSSTMGPEGLALCNEKWSDAPPPLGMVDGVADSSDRLKAIGNGQVPQCMATAWNILTGDWFE